MNIVYRHSVDMKFKGDKYLSVIADAAGETQLVRGHIKGDVTLKEIVMFTDTFEGKPAIGGLFVFAEGDKPEIGEIKVETYKRGDAK
jgi:hypothetical protein